jgi:OOP family OmpA-OmpF porin
MKKISFILSGALLALSCNQVNKQDKSSEIKTEQTAIDENTIENTSAEKFNIEDIPYSNADLGSFPYFSLPSGLKNQNKPLQRNFDVCFFPIAGTMTPFEGKLYKINVVGDGTEPFSKRYFEKSLVDYLNSIGATEVFNGEITKEEYDRYHKQDPNKGDEGDIGYFNEQITVYVLRTKDNGNVYVQFSSNNASGKLNILQEESFKQTITKITADDIIEDLSQKQKSILYINFETDKANVTVEGKYVVDQIAQALKKDISLKIGIEGHTDNTGDAAHNKHLSNARANAVMDALISAGIDKSRLSAKGFGAERPLTANDTEENKAKNRRVELVKTN